MRFANAWRLGAAAILAATFAAAPALAQWDRAAEGKFDRTLQVSGEVDLDDGLVVAAFVAAVP